MLRKKGFKGSSQEPQNSLPVAAGSAVCLNSRGGVESVRKA
jgi:hypothetical protein